MFDNLGRLAVEGPCATHTCLHLSTGLVLSAGARLEPKLMLKNYQKYLIYLLQFGESINARFFLISNVKCF